MATSFFGGAFFGGEFFSATTGVATGGITGGGYVRYFTPTPSSRKRKRIDAAIRTETRIKKQIEEYQDTGVDLKVLDSLYAKLRELQTLILMLALESAEAQNYIGLKRIEAAEEEEDIKFIIKLL